jgi:hypothetical protein
MLAAHLLDAEPIIGWWRNPDRSSPRCTAWGNALLIGACEYLVDMATGALTVKAYLDPRSMRFQSHQWHHPQPCMHPSRKWD